MEVIIDISLICMLAFGIMAVESSSIVKSAVYLALSSVMLGVVMYVLGAPWAAVFEVSVCSGLVTVIFISAISLSQMKKDEKLKTFAYKKRMAYLPTALIIGGVLLVVIALTQKFTLPTSPAVSESFREIFWNSRQADIFGQIVAILVGGIAVAVLFEGDKPGKKS
jgi:NADH-quinone oxidoreductase subunit J